MPTTLRFPGDNYDNEVPVFLVFYWNKYSRYNSDRTFNTVKGGGNSITIPYPKLFNVTNEVPYSNQGTLVNNPMDNLKMAMDNVTFEAGMMYSYFFKGGSSFTFDNMETVLMPGARRKYAISMDLVAKNAAQATKIKQIADTFQLNAFSSWDGGNKLIWQHPPLWVMQTVKSGELTGWSPTSLPSVLTRVDINKNPILDTPFNLPNNYPLAMNITLAFTELEPAVNNKGILTNRAATFG